VTPPFYEKIKVGQLTCDRQHCVFLYTLKTSTAEWTNGAHEVKWCWWQYVALLQTLPRHSQHVKLLEFSYFVRTSLWSTKTTINNVNFTAWHLYYPSHTYGKYAVTNKLLLSQKVYLNCCKQWT